MYYYIDKIHIFLRIVSLRIETYGTSLKTERGILHPGLASLYPVGNLMFQCSSDKIIKLLDSDNGYHLRATVQNNTTHGRAPLAEHTTLLFLHTEVLVNNLELSSNQQTKYLPLGRHNENTPMQYTAIFHGC